MGPGSSLLFFRYPGLSQRTNGEGSPMMVHPLLLSFVVEAHLRSFRRTPVISQSLHSRLRPRECRGFTSASSPKRLVRICPHSVCGSVDPSGHLGAVASSHSHASQRMARGSVSASGYRRAGR
jgi:hypothetical protein